MDHFFVVGLFFYFVFVWLFLFGWLFFKIYSWKGIMRERCLPSSSSPSLGQVLVGGQELVGGRNPSQLTVGSQAH